MHPPVPHRSSSSSLAGAVIDLTGDDGTEDSARKKRKLDHHSPAVAGPSSQPPGSINAHLSTASGSLNWMGEQASQTRADMLPTELFPTPSPHNQHPMGLGMTSAAPPAAAATDQQASIPPLAQLHSLAPVPVPMQDIVTAQEAQPEPQTTLEEDCLEANFDEDEED